MYELVDLNTGNWVGAYPTKEEALRAVADTIRRYGEDAVVTLALGRFERGRQGEAIAEGPKLAEMALAAA